MKASRGFTLIVIVVMILTFSGCRFSSNQDTRLPALQLLSKSYAPPEFTFEQYKTPPDVIDPDELLDFSDVAWKTFVALNWPSDCAGNPLSDKQFGQEQTAPRLWELYRTPEEVFLQAGQRPCPLPSPDVCSQNNRPALRSVRLDLTEGKGLVSQPEVETIRRSFARSANLRQGLGFPAPKPQRLTDIPLVDQQGNYVLIETHLNPDELRQIVENEWYAAKSFAKYSNKPKERFQFAAKTTSSLSDGVAIETEACKLTGPVNPSTVWSGAPIEIKAAWRVFNSCEDGSNSTPGTGQSCNSAEQKERYYTTKREIAIPACQYAATSQDPKCQTQEPVKRVVDVGLIGFHLLYKIPNQVNSKTPGWIWATFEHVDNLSKPDGATWKPTLYDPDCQTCEANKPLAAPYFWQDPLPHAVTLDQNTGQIQPHNPTQVVLFDSSLPPQKSQDELKGQNQTWQKAFKDANPASPWQYYQLNGVEWLGNPQDITWGPPGTWDDAHWQTVLNKLEGGIAPGPLVNVTMEAYAQRSNGFGNKCIACHLKGATLPDQKTFSDFSFLLGHAK